MPQPRDLEDALSQLMKANPGYSRADALEIVQNGLAGNDPKFTSIPNIEDSMHTEHVRSFTGTAARHFFNTMFALPRMAVSGALAEAGPEYTESARKMGLGYLTDEAPPSKERPESTAGAIVGDLGAFAVPEVGPAGLVEKLPLVGKLPSLMRGAATGGILGASGALGGPVRNPFADPQGPNAMISPTATGAIFGAGGDALGKAWDLIGSRFGGAVAKSSTEEVLAPEDIGSEAQPKPTEPSPFGAPQEPFGIKPQTSGASDAAEQLARQSRAGSNDLSQGVRAPVELTEAMESGSAIPTGPRVQTPENRQAWFAIPPASRKQGFLQSAEERLRQSTMEPVGTVSMREGQPFEISAHNSLNAQRKGMQVYAYPTSTLGRLGAPARALLERPMIVDVPSSGTQSFIDAARSLYSNDSNVLKSLDSAKDQIGLAQELIGRYAKDRGFDSVSISTPDIQENVILDLKRFKASDHPEEAKFLKGEAPKAGPFESEPLPSIMGGPRAISPETLQKLMKEARATRGQSTLDTPEQTATDHGSSAAIFDDPNDLGPEWSAANREIHEASLSGLAKWRPVAHAIDHPKWQAVMQRILGVRSQGDKLYKALTEASAKLRETVGEDKFDEVHRAWLGLRYDQSTGRLIQTALNVAPDVDKAARQLETGIAGKAYTYLTGNDSRLPSLMERFGLQHSRKQILRLQQIQLGLDPGKVTHEEQIVAAASKGWLGFDESHDLDIEPGKGFLSFYSVENERAKVENAVNFLEAHKQSGYGSTSAQDTIAKLAKYRKRLEFIDGQVRREQLRQYPMQDVLPRFKSSEVLKMSNDPAARPLFPETNVEKLLSKYLQGVVDKRQSDVVLTEARKLLKDPEFQRGDVKNYITDYANAVRGSRGFKGDLDWANKFNAAFGTKFTAGDMHRITSTIMHGMQWTRLFISPVRFPIINLTHLFVGLYPVVGEKIFARAVADVMANPKRWFAEAAEAGAIRRESDWIREIGEPETMSIKGPASRALHSLTYVTEEFRRAVAYRAGLITEPEEWSPLVKAFNPKGHANLLEAKKAYARGLTLTTQFETSMINKPGAFTGSPFRRLATQFRTWPSNIASLYVDMFRKKQWPSLLRGMGTLWFFGGVSAVAGGPEIYGRVRDHFLREGVVLPDETGAKWLSDTLGFQGTPIEWVTGMNLYSLHDPFALVPPNLAGFLGPSIGGVVDTVQQADTAIKNEDTDRLANIALGAVSPQARAMVEAGMEYFNNGEITGPNGHLELTRPLAATIMRGLDLTPSARSVRYSDMMDLASAMESGNQSTIEQMRQKADRDGIVLDAKFWQSVKRIVKERQKKHIGPETIWNSL